MDFWAVSGGFCGSGVLLVEFLVVWWISGVHQTTKNSTRNTPEPQNPPEIHQKLSTTKIHQKFHQNSTSPPRLPTTNQPEPQNPPEIHHPEFHQKHFRTTKSASNRTEIKQTTQNSTRDTSPHHQARNQPETLHKCSINLPEILHLASINLPYQ